MQDWRRERGISKERQDLLDKLKLFGIKLPDMPLGQLIYNAMRDTERPDLFDIENDELSKRLDEFMDRSNGVLWRRTED